jgi:hypothetical protein
MRLANAAFPYRWQITLARVAEFAELVRGGGDALLDGADGTKEVAEKRPESGETTRDDAEG